MSESHTPNPPSAPLPHRARRINPWNLFFGAMVPNWLLMRPEVSQGAKLCYARLAQYAGKHNDCRPKQSTLAAELGVSERMAHEYLHELQKHGLIEMDRRGLGRPNRYHFIAHPWMHQAPDVQSAAGPDPQETAASEPQSSSGPVVEENQLKRIKGYNSAQKSQEPNLPSTESQAAEWAAPCGVPSDFAMNEFNRLVAVGWLDGCTRPIQRWREYIKSRWAREQSERAERALRPAARSHPRAASPAKVRISDLTFTETKI